MSTSIVTASFQLNTGETVDMYTSMTEATNATSTSELLTSTKYAVTATSIGTYANGKTITSITQPVTGTNNIVFAYLERRGAIMMILPVAKRGVQSATRVPYAQIVLQAGDTIQVCSAANATRSVGYNVITTSGVHAIFSGTDASGDIELLHCLSGQGIGASLTGQTITAQFGVQCSASSALNTSAGVYILNDRGLPVGASPLTVMANVQPVINSTGLASIGLNFIARVTSSA